MHVSLPIMAEKLPTGLMRIVRSEERRGIVSVATDAGLAADNVLLVCAGSLTASLPELPRHLLLVNACQEELDACSAVPNLATIQLGGGVPEAYALVSSVLLALAQWDARMLEAIATRQGVAAVLVIAAEELANPIALFDSKQTLLAHAGTLPASAEGTIWHDILANQHLEDEYFTVEERSRAARLTRGSWPVLLAPSRDPEHKHLTAILRVDGQEVGSIGQVDVTAPFSPGQIALSDLVADRLRIALAMRLGNGPGEDDTSYLLRSILNGNKTDRGLAAYHLAQMGWDAESGFVLALCPMPQAGRTPISDQNRLARLQRAWPRAIVMLYEDSVIVLADGRHAEAPASFVGILEAFSMHLVASEPFFSLDEVRLAYDQCRLVERAGAAPQTQGALRLSCCMEQVLPVALEAGDSARCMADSRIVKLVREGYKGDVERGRDLAAELFAYLMNGCNYNQTARELYLHRNTLIYHIEQLEKLLGVSLSDATRPYRLYLAVSCLVALDAV